MEFQDPLEAFRFNLSESARMNITTITRHMCELLCGAEVEIGIAGATLWSLREADRSGLNLSPSEGISWQTAWWSLVPLAIAAMTQPCGNVLGRKDKNFRFYSRASPIICIIDVFHFVVCMALCFSVDPRLILRNMKFELRERLYNDGGDGDSHLDAERTRLARWTLLIIGGIPCQTIKLVATDGMVWTKFWAISFFNSMVFWEVMTLLSQLLQTNHAVQLPVPRWRRESLWSVRTMRMASSLAFACHFFAVYEAAAILFYWALFSVSDLQFRHALAITAFLTIFIALSPIIIQHLRGHRFIDDIPLMLLTLLVMVLAVVTAAKGVFKPGLFSAELENWNRIRSPLDDYFLVQRLFRVDSAAGSAAVFTCVSTFLFSLFWYCFIFQPWGTYLPDWTEVFG
ncbi:hypothetical protein QBC37DRAFT_316048 [Rhypophila decipiens]|uniref:Uncharacterized protein n=1 Tax=Rhypophila decipiens TaxID=261697 RepID=A0AAN6Y7E0_9PEZI|nr:hypothetical protein QBC37DRAFT_316048 [Rhypophila decipiens]